MSRHHICKIGIRQAQRSFYSNLPQAGTHMVITKRGKPVNVLLAYDDYKSISSLNQAKDIVFLENFGVDDLTQNKDFIKYTEEMAKDFIKNPSKYPVLSKKFKNLINKRKESNDQNTSHHHH